METVHLNTKLLCNLDNILFLSSVKIREATGIKTTTWYALMQKPEKITIQQLLALANGLHIPVRRFFSTSKTDIVGKRSDYVVEEYTPCRYDSDALQKLVDRSPDITWKKASCATDVTRDNLRRSLLGIRRTPVTRFLKTCDALEIDPFEILIDPNHEKVQNKRIGTDTSNLTENIAALRRELKQLSATVDDLTKKFEALQKRLL